MRVVAKSVFHLCISSAHRIVLIPERVKTFPELGVLLLLLMVVLLCLLPPSVCGDVTYMGNGLMDTHTHTHTHTHMGERWLWNWRLHCAAPA